MDIYIAYGFSVLTAILAIVLVQFNGMALILIGHITTNLLTALSYVFVGGWSGSAICFTAIVQSIVMFLYERKGIKPHLAVILLFVVAYVTCSVLFYKSIFDIFSGAAAVCFAISVAQEKPFFSRIWFAIDMALWTVYDVSCKQYANLIMHSVILCSIIVAFVRVDKIFCKKTVVNSTDKTEEFSHALAENPTSDN